MKLLAIFLAITILFLAVKPGIDYISMQINTEQGCCAGECKPVANKRTAADQQPQTDHCEEGACNPFQSCSMFVLHCDTKTSFNLSIPVVLLKLNFSYQSAFCSQFASDFWQPPRIA